MLDQTNPLIPESSSESPEPGLHMLRDACKICGSEYGVLILRGGQNCVYCADCGRWLYNAPKTETGQATRSVSTIHNGIKPKQRSRIIERATGRCELCGNGIALHVGHLLSVLDGIALGLTEFELNNDENLAAMCEECNLGIGSLPISPRLYVALLARRIER